MKNIKMSLKKAGFVLASVLLLATSLPGLAGAATSVNWSLSTVVPDGITYMAASSNGTKIVTVKNGGDIYISSDGGATWNDASELPANTATAGLAWHSVASSADGTRLAAAAWNGVSGEGAAGEVWTSSDSGATWVMRADDLPPDGLAIISDATGQYLTLTSNDSGMLLYTSSDYGATWTLRADINASTGGMFGAAVSSDGTVRLTGTHGGNLFVSTNAGVSWTDVSALPANSALTGQHWAGAFAVDSTGATLYAAGYGGAVWKSTDHGVSWTNLSALPANTALTGWGWSGLATNSDGSVVVVQDIIDGALWVSTDSGLTWTDYSSEDLGMSAQSPLAITSDNSTIIGAGYQKVIFGAITRSVNSTTFANAGDSKSVALTTPDGTNITCASSQAVDASYPDGSYTYPLGLADFCFTTGSSSNQVTLTFVTSLTPSQVAARKYNPSTHAYSALTDATVTETTYGGQHALQVTYTIIDNGPLDTDPAVGSIADPVGLAVLPGVPNTGLLYHTPLLQVAATACGVLGVLGVIILARRRSVGTTK